MTWSRYAVVLAMLPVSAAAQVQSALHPHSDRAAQLVEITWVMFIGAALIFVLVAVLLVLAMVGPQHMRQQLGQIRLIVYAAIAFPVVVLTALLVYTFSTSSSDSGEGVDPAARIEVIGEMWWWRVRYLDADGRTLFETANDIRIPSGEPVEFVLKSDNVIHSFWVPNLAGKLDMVPGHVNRLRVQAQAPGLFRGQCAEYCGAQHAKMMFELRALPPDDYRAWVQAQRLPAREPTTPQLQTGKRIAVQACAKCHTIRGTEAAGTLGPDLTHIGSRSSLAAGVLPNGAGALAGWIAASQQIKPGNHMPSFDQFTGRELRAVAQYMESLK